MIRFVLESQTVNGIPFSFFKWNTQKVEYVSKLARSTSLCIYGESKENQVTQQ